MKLNSDEETLAESKILLLYIISKIQKPISHNELLDLVSNITDINYFYFEQFLLDLLEDQYIEIKKQENVDIYEITELGKNTVNLTIDTIPGIERLQVDSNFKKTLDSIKDKYSITAEYSIISEKEYLVKCKIVENNTTIFDIQTIAGSKEQAKMIVDNWNNNAVKIYPKILEELINENNDKED